MPVRNSSSADAIARLVAGTPAKAVELIAWGLETMEITLASSAVGISALRGMTPQTAERAARTFPAIRGVIDEATLAFALRAANAVRDIELVDRPEIEIVWTGPDSEGPTVRPTGAVVEEMLGAVRDHGEVLLVGYSITTEAGTLMAGVVELLGAAALRGAGITIVLHRDDDGRNLAAVRRAWNVLAKKPRILTWEPPREHPYTKLHAKALVVDRLDALVTSANLTFHGLESNLELGLRVRGPQAGWIAQKFDNLIGSKVLKEWAE